MGNEAEREFNAEIGALAIVVEFLLAAQLSRLRPAQRTSVMESLLANAGDPSELTQTLTDVEAEEFSDVVVRMREHIRGLFERAIVAAEKSSVERQ